MIKRLSTAALIAVTVGAITSPQAGAQLNVEPWANVVCNSPLGPDDPPEVTRLSPAMPLRSASPLFGCNYYADPAEDACELAINLGAYARKTVVDADVEKFGEANRPVLATSTKLDHGIWWVVTASTCAEDPGGNAPSNGAEHLAALEEFGFEPYRPPYKPSN